MFQVLSHRRLDHALSRDPAEVPELVVAAVLGACRYLPDPAAVLVPFLGSARVEGAGRLLLERLEGVDGASVALWPPAPGVDGGGAPPLEAPAWSAEDASGPGGDADGPEPEDDPFADRDAAEAAAGDDDDPGDEGGETVPVPAPDALVTLRRPGQPDAWILVESVAPDGRLSGIDGAEDPGARLAAHWRAARRAAGAAGVPLAIVLVSSSGSVPGVLFAWARAALRRVGEPPAPLYGLSWRVFPACARAAGPLSPLLADVVDLLEEAWGLGEVSLQPWPDPSTLPAVGLPARPFAAAFRWPPPPPCPALPPSPEVNRE
jgi:hypothetical protein